MNEYLSVGFVTKPHGVRGLIKIEPLTDDVTRFNKMKHVFIEEAGNYVKYEIISRSIAPDHVLLKLKGIDNATDAEALRGKYLFRKRDEGRTLKEGEYYWCDVIGLDVVYADNGKKIGVLDSIINTVSNDVYVVKTDKDEICLPALKQYVTIDMENKRITVNRNGLEEILPDED